MRLVLASKSPRRKELLDNIGVKFHIKPAHIDENIDEKDPVKYAEKLALNKACAVYTDQDEIVIGSDTIVVYKDKILGKPVDREQAFEYIKMLSGNEHQVITALAIKGNSIENTSHSTTKVSFMELNDIEINKYLDTMDWTDKAGGYGIQGYASIFIDKIEGCYFNVVGFPVNLFYTMMKKNGINILENLKWE